MPPLILEGPLDVGADLEQIPEHVAEKRAGRMNRRGFELTDRVEMIVGSKFVWDQKSEMSITGD